MISYLLNNHFSPLFPIIKEQPTECYKIKFVKSYINQNGYMLTFLVSQLFNNILKNMKLASEIIFGTVFDQFSSLPLQLPEEYTIILIEFYVPKLLILFFLIILKLLIKLTVCIFLNFSINFQKFKNKKSILQNFNSINMQKNVYHFCMSW